MCSFFFFKQKTAYEMRISDWSSDVCSSDLREVLQLLQRAEHRREIVGDRRGRFSDRVADETAGGLSIVLDHDGVAVGEGTLVAGGTPATDVPGGFARLPQLVPEVERDALACVVHQFGKHRRVRPHRRTESRLVHGAATL